MTGFATHYWAGPLTFSTDEKRVFDGQEYYQYLFVFFENHSGENVLYHDDPKIVWSDINHFSRPVWGSDGKDYTLFCYLDDNRTPHFYKLVGKDKTFQEKAFSITCYHRENERIIPYYPEFQGDGEPPTFHEWKKIRAEKKPDKIL